MSTVFLPTAPYLEQGVVVERRLGLAADLVHDLHRLDWEAACCRLTAAAGNTGARQLVNEEVDTQADIEFVGCILLRSCCPFRTDEGPGPIRCWKSDGGDGTLLTSLLPSTI